MPPSARPRWLRRLRARDFPQSCARSRVRSLRAAGGSGCGGARRGQGVVRAALRPTRSAELRWGHGPEPAEAGGLRLRGARSAPRAPLPVSQRRARVTDPAPDRGLRPPASAGSGGPHARSSDQLQKLRVARVARSRNALLPHCIGRASLARHLRAQAGHPVSAASGDRRIHRGLLGAQRAAALVHGSDSGRTSSSGAVGSHPTR